MITHAPDRNAETPPEVLWIGVDVSKAELQLHAAGPLPGLPAKLRYDKAGLQALLKHLAARPRPHLVFEASGGYEKPLLLWLQAHGVACSRVNPRRVRNFARAKGMPAKTDAIDAAVLAAFGATLQPAATPCADPAFGELAALVNYRRHLSAELGRERMQLEHVLPKAVAALVKARIRALEGQVEKLGKLIGKAVAAHSLLERAVAALSAVEGVGVLTAAALLAAMPELGTVCRNEAAALAGLAPLNRDSGPCAASG